MLTEILRDITREIAWRLSHRSTPLVFGASFALTLALGGDPSELAPRVMALLFCTALASGALSLSPQRRLARLAQSASWGLLLWALCVGPAIGSLSLVVGEESDHYWVGSKKRAAVHFGQPLRLSTEGDQLLLSAGFVERGLQRAQLSRAEAIAGAQIELAGHQLQVTKLQASTQLRAATLRIRSRQHPEEEGTRLRVSLDERAPLSAALEWPMLTRGDRAWPGSLRRRERGCLFGLSRLPFLPYIALRSRYARLGVSSYLPSVRASFESSFCQAWHSAPSRAPPPCPRWLPAPP